MFFNEKFEESKHPFKQDRLEKVWYVVYSGKQPPFTNSCERRLYCNFQYPLSFALAHIVSSFTATNRMSRRISMCGRQVIEAKFWLVPIKLAFNHGFSNPKLNSVAKLIQEYHPIFLQAWNDYFV